MWTPVSCCCSVETDGIESRCRQEILNIFKKDFSEITMWTQESCCRSVERDGIESLCRQEILNIFKEDFFRDHYVNPRKLLLFNRKEWSWISMQTGDSKYFQETFLVITVCIQESWSWYCSVEANGIESRCIEKWVRLHKQKNVKPIK